MATFQLAGVDYPFTAEQLARVGYLQSLVEASGMTTVELNAEQIIPAQFQVLYDYIVHNKPLDFVGMTTAEAFNVSPIDTYALTLVAEADMRKNMYTEPKRFRDQHYRLFLLTKEFFESLPFVYPVESDVLFTGSKVYKDSWVNIQAKLRIFEKILAIPGTYIAGGAIFSILFNLPINDVDIFIYGVSQTKANDILAELCAFLPYGNEDKNGLPYGDGTCVRTANSVTIQIPRTGGKQEGRKQPNSTTKAYMFQIILRLYKTQSEVLHGFDVDSCCLGYDGRGIWLTERCWYALYHRVNTVNFNYLSPSYEARLAKYGARGIAVKIPNFELSKVQITAQDVDAMFKGTKQNWRTRAKANEYKNLDRLIFLDGVATYMNYSKRFIRAVFDITERLSDYGYVRNGLHGQRIEDITEDTDIVWIEAYNNWHMYTKNIYRQILAGFGGNSYVDDESFKQLIYHFREAAKDYPDVQDALEYEIETYAMALKLSDDIQYDFSGYRDEVINRIRRTLMIMTEDVSINSTQDSEFYNFTYMRNYLTYNGNPERYPPRVTAMDYLAVSEIVKAHKVEDCWKIPFDVKWKVTNPGEQMTGTFHSLVLQDTSLWYNGKLYQQ
jgi:hypothetical protein